MDTNQCQVCGNFFVTDISLINHIETHSKKELYQCIIGLKQTLILLHSPQHFASTSNLTTPSGNLATSVNNQTATANTPVTPNHSMAASSSGNLSQMSPEAQDGEDITKSKEEGGFEDSENLKDTPYKLSPTRQEEMEKYYAAQLALFEQMHNMQNSEMLYGSNNLGVPSSEEGEGGNSLLNCEICQRKFSTPYTLKRHLLSHSNKRPDICPICGKGFIGKQNLVVHLRIHTGEKPYKCNICGKAFTQYGTLYRHKQIHAGKSEQGDHSTVDPETGSVTGHVDESDENQEGIRQSSDTGDENDGDMYEDIHKQSDREQHAASVTRMDTNHASMLQGCYDNLSSTNSNTTHNSGTVDRHHSNSTSIEQLNRNHNSSASLPSMDQLSRHHGNNTPVQSAEQQDTGGGLSDGAGVQSNALSGSLHLTPSSQSQLSSYQSALHDRNRDVSSETTSRFNKTSESPASHSSFENPPSYHQGHFQSPSYPYLQSRYNNYSESQNVEQRADSALSLSSKPNFSSPRNCSPQSSGASIQSINDNKTESNREPLQSFSSLTESLLRKRNLSPGLVIGQKDLSGDSRNNSSENLTPSQSHSAQSHVLDYSSILSYKSPSSLGSAASYLHNSSTYGIGSAVSEKIENKSEGFPPLVCKFCTLKFESQVALDAHQKQHTEKNLVWCEICHCKFTTPFSLRRHMKIHTGERTEECSICGKRFIDKPRLVVHMRTHTGDKPYKCTACVRTFSRRDALRRHLKTHMDSEGADVAIDTKVKTEENNDEQHEVSKNTSNASAQMFVHLDNNNRPTVSTYFEQKNKENGTASAETHSDLPSTNAPVDMRSDVSVKSENESVSSDEDMDCPDQTHDHSSLNESHDSLQTEEDGLPKPSTNRSINEINEMLMKNFTTKVEGPKPYRCDVCCRTYTMPSCLRRHMLVHTGLKPNKCDVCGKSFVEKQQLAVHYRIHTGERPHKCHICFKRFTQYGTLHNHMQVHKKQQISDVMDKMEENLDSAYKQESDQMSDVEPHTTSASNETAHQSTDSPGTPERERINNMPVYPRMSVEHDHSREWEDDEEDRETTKPQSINEDSTADGANTSAGDISADDNDITNYATRLRYGPGMENSQNIASDSSVTSQVNNKETPPNGVDTDNESAKSGVDTKNIKTEQQDVLNRYPFDFYSNMYGFPAAGLMSLNLLASTSEFHQSLIEYMGQVQRARMLGLSDLANASTYQENQEATNPTSPPRSVESNDVGLNLSVSAEEKSVGHKCDKCNMQFLDKSALLNHLQSHMSSPTSSNSELAMMSPKGGKSHTCKTCGKSFSASFCLRRHEMIHSGQKPFKCDFCPKAFVEKQHLACHRRIHTGEKPFTCKVCQKSFTQYGTLHKHLRTHTKDKKYKCQFCDKAYYERRQLTNHMLSHFEYRKHVKTESTPSAPEEDSAHL